MRVEHLPFGAQVAFVWATELGGLGTIAVGALTIGALAIRAVAVKRGRFERLNIEQLEVGRATGWEPVVGRSELLHGGGYLVKFQVNELRHISRNRAKST
jgi:hypothetical protein